MSRQSYRSHTARPPKKTPRRTAQEYLRGERATTTTPSSTQVTREDLRRSGDLGLAVLEGLRETGVIVFDHDLRLTLVEGDTFSRHGVATELLEGHLLSELVPPEPLA